MFDIQDSDLAIDDVHFYRDISDEGSPRNQEFGSLSFAPDYLCLPSKSHSWLICKDIDVDDVVPEQLSFDPEKVDSLMHFSDHNNQTDVISPNSQEKLCQAMKSTELPDDRDLFSVDIQLYAVISNWTGLLWILDKFDDWYLILNMSSKYTCADIASWTGLLCTALFILAIFALFFLLLVLSQWVLQEKNVPAAMGFTFAAGTTDRPGAFDFTQGDDQGNAFWKLTDEKQIKCQDPKPIVIDSGEIHEPYDWVPSILSVQNFQIGQLVILNVPGGRCLRQAVKEVMTFGNKDSNVHVVIAGLTNTYLQYVTTFEEYQIQRYEPSDSSFMDATPLGSSFGDCITDVPPGSIFKRGDVVTVMFWSACPRNDHMTEGTYALVEILQSDKNWEPTYDDDHWCLKFKWSKPSKLSTRSYATIEWEIPDIVVSGVYRITHFSASRSLFGSVNHFTGSSAAFTVT
uniref:Neutral ceramidase n=1 Tax=Tanacetum cinerariifolium TaxID=118510 RepID=A0A699HJV1_TANCI|nr:hypothetical protein [Tanacetum cinerariifolium]